MCSLLFNHIKFRIGRPFYWISQLFPIWDGLERSAMALVTDCCLRWQCHQMRIIPFNAWSGYRLSLVPKLVFFSYSGERQQGRDLFGQSTNSGVGKIAQLKRNSCPRIQSKLNGLNPFSKFGPSSEVSDEGQVDDHRPPFDLDMAVLLAGFAFESYNTPAVNKLIPFSHI